MKKLFTFILAAVTSIGMWAETCTINCNTTSTDALFSVAEELTQYDYSSKWTDYNLIKMDKGTSITITNVTGATISAVSVEGVADNNSNQTVNFTMSDGTTTAATSSGSWNNRKTSSSLTSKALNATNVAKMKHGIGQTYTITNNSSSSYNAGVRIVITYTPAAPAVTHTLTWDFAGGSCSATAGTNYTAGGDVAEGATITYPANNTMSKDGYDFNGWSTSVTTMPTSDLTITAQWVDHVAKYTVVYKDGETTLGSEQVAVGETPEGITPTKDCYTFAAWSPALNTVSGEEDAEVVVNATWTPIYAQSFDFGATTDLTKDNIKSKLNAVGIACKVGTGGAYDSGATAGYLGYKFKNNGDYVAFIVKDGYKATVTYGFTQSGWKVNGVDAGVATGQGKYVEKEYIADGSDQLFKLENQSADTKTSVLTKIVIAENIPSDDATIKSLTVNGEAVEAVEDVYSYVVGSTIEATKVAVVFVLNDAKATADKESGFEINVPEAGAAANTATITVTAEDETQKVYTVSVTKATAASTDATLKALSVEGFTLAPAFDPAVVEYTITKAYEAALPATSKVTATANDANATVNVAYNELVENEILVQVIAEDEETAKTYSIRVLSAPAVKSLSRVLFSNGFDAFIDNTNRTVKAFYLDGTEAPTATTITAGANCTAGEIVEGKITVTGADESVVDYTVTLEAVTPNTATVAESANAGAFDGTETWVKNGLLVYGNSAGWVANDKYYVLRRQLKSGDAADDQRVIAGWVRTYFFVGNASKLELTIANNNKVKYAIDGGEQVASESNSLSITLEAGNHMIEIVTNQSSGDCRISAPKLVERPSIPSAISNTSAATKAQKRIENGQLVIEKNGQVFNAMGQTIR